MLVSAASKMVPYNGLSALFKHNEGGFYLRASRMVHVVGVQGTSLIPALSGGRWEIGREVPGPFQATVLLVP